MTSALLWDSIAETMPRSQLEALQSELLVRQVAYVYENAPIFKELYDNAAVRPSDIRSVADLVKLPILEKLHLRDFRRRHKDPFAGAACVPISQLFLASHSTGTSGSPTLYGLTRHDYEVIGDLYARVLYSIGFRSGYRWAANGLLRWHGYQVAAEYGAQKIGVVPIPMARPPRGDTLPGLFEDWGDVDFHVLGHYQPEFEIPYLRSRPFKPLEIFPNLRFLSTGVDLSRTRRRIVEGAWGVPIRNTYGSGDQYLAGGECQLDQPYFHMPEDRYMLELLDPLSGEPVGPGQPGELHVTNLWAEGFPFIRYRMEDVAVAKYEPCACGRTSMRLRVLGRLAWSVDVGGRRVFNSEVEDVLWSHPDLEVIAYQLVRRQTQPQQRLEVRLAKQDGDVELAEQAADLLERQLGVPAVVTFLEEGGIGHGLKMQRLVVVD